MFEEEYREAFASADALVLAPVFHAQRHVESLEEMFLEATGGETVD